jgi:20S proteasome alpha/beta subunit
MAMKNIRRIALLVFACILVAGIQPQRVWSQNNSGKGTLGLLIITKEGMVLAADSRTIYSSGAQDDSAVKIFQLGRNSGCMLAGTVFVQSNSVSRGFDLGEEIRKVSQRSRLIDDPDYFLTSLSQQLENAIYGAGKQTAPGKFFDDDTDVASLLIGGYSVSTGDPALPDHYFEKAFKLSILTTPSPSIEEGNGVAAYNQPNSEVLRRYQVLDVHGPGPFAIFTNGNDQLLKSILAHRRTIFLLTSRGMLREISLTELSREEALNTYFELREGNQLDAMSLEQAVRLADALIRINIELAGTDLGIGGQVDIATITREDGFRWVPGHSPEEFGAADRWKGNR